MAYLPREGLDTVKRYVVVVVLVLLTVYVICYIGVLLYYIISGKWF